MKKLIAILLLLSLLCGCAVSNGAKTTQSGQTQEASAEPETFVPDPTSVPGSTSVPGPTPVPGLTEADLPVEVAFNAQALTETDGVYSVVLPEEETDRPTAPTYIWYINGSDADVIDEVVIEFDVFDTVRPLDGMYFGYDQAFYIILHNFDTLPSLPPWCAEDILFKRDDIDEIIMIRTPELGVDLKKYAEWENEHVRIAIPYSEFQNASKELTLQFLPGTTYGHLSICLWGENGLYADTADTISQRIEYPERDLANEVIEPLFTDGMEPFPIVSAPADELGGRIHGGSYDPNVIMEGLVINPDGSVDMPVVFYDLGDYASQVKGDYAVIPEGIVSALATLKGYNCFSEDQMRQVVTFVVDNIMNEDGQFYGVYDIEQQKLVATERKVATLPILSELAGFRSLERGPDTSYKIVSDDVTDLIVNSIIADEIVRVGDKLYYAPYGIGTDGVMDLKLSDFAITGSLFNLLTEYSCDASRLDEEYGGAMLLEGIANSLKLILEGQEQNATRLPSSELRVVFSDGGESYELQPSDTFCINNSYFSIGLKSFQGFYNTIDQFAFYKTGFNESIDHTVMRLTKVKDGAYSQNQVQAIREIEARYAEMTNAYAIANTLYKSWLDVYNFLKVQTNDTIYANAYNVQTGKIIDASNEVNYNSFEWFTLFAKRFGTPATSMNYFLLAGVFNDKEMALESGHLTLVNLDAFMQIFISVSRYMGATNPDMYADIGFNIWGYDSLRYAVNGDMPVKMETYPLFYASGTNMNRENWKVFAMRKINQFTDDEAYFLTPEDELPTFYDHIQAVTIVN